MIRTCCRTASADDAGVYRIDRDRALVQTVDFFTPIVDDPFLYGQIAAAQRLVGCLCHGRPTAHGFEPLGRSDEVVPPKVIAAILRGGAAKAKEAGCAIVGGHSIRNPEPILRPLSDGLVSPRG